MLEIPEKLKKTGLITGLTGLGVLLIVQAAGWVKLNIYTMFSICAVLSAALIFSFSMKRKKQYYMLLGYGVSVSYTHLNGQVSPLIELGAGFDGNMTARENIFLNGCLLGHSQRFMEEHFDEIVEFAELKEFLDSPIKNYSSGMTARLGFSIATMVRPEILIVDEVLAVGDFKFRPVSYTHLDVYKRQMYAVSRLRKRMT